MGIFIGQSRLRLGAASTATQIGCVHPKEPHNPINIDILLDSHSKNEFLPCGLASGAGQGVIVDKAKRPYDITVHIASS
jgi:hypothetical protein